MAGNKTDVVTVFKADISQFSESVTSLKRYISTVNSEFKVATKGSSDWAKSQDGLKAKITQLNRTLQAQEQIVAELEKEYNSLDLSQEKNKEAAQKLTIEINKYRFSITISISLPLFLVVLLIFLYLFFLIVTLLLETLFTYRCLKKLIKNHFPYYYYSIFYFFYHKL